MDSSLVYTAFVISVVGLILLAYASETLQPPLCRIGDITSNDVGRNLHISGNISKVHKFRGGSLLLYVRDSSGGIDVYLPNNVASVRADVLNASEVDLVGSLEIYQGKLEIVVSNPSSLKVKK